jgi:hypothetical protein
MYREIIAIYYDDLMKLTNNVQEKNARRLLFNLMLRLQSNEFSESNKLPSWKIFVNTMFQLAEKFCTVLGTQKILNLCTVLQI